MNLDSKVIKLIEKLVYVHSITIDTLNPSNQEWEKFETEFKNIEDEISVLDIGIHIHVLFLQIRESLNNRDVVSIASYVIDMSMLIEDNQDSQDEDNQDSQDEDNQDEDNQAEDSQDEDEDLESVINKKIRKVYVAIYNHYDGYITIDDIPEIGNKILNYIQLQEIPYKNVNETLDNILYQIKNMNFIINIYFDYTNNIHNGEYDLLIEDYLLSNSKLF